MCPKFWTYYIWYKNRVPTKIALALMCQGFAESCTRPCLYILYCHGVVHFLCTPTLDNYNTKSGRHAHLAWNARFSLRSCHALAPFDFGAFSFVADIYIIYINFLFLFTSFSTKFINILWFFTIILVFLVFLIFIRFTISLGWFTIVMILGIIISGVKWLGVVGFEVRWWWEWGCG